jgi:hypothetical protein
LFLEFFFKGTDAFFDMIAAAATCSENSSSIDTIDCLTPKEHGCSSVFSDGQVL